MNEKRIEQVLEIEKKAQAILDAATHDAEQLPAQAEQESRDIIERARTEARQEAENLLGQAKSEQEAASIVSKAEQKNREIEQQATKNMDKAVAFLLERVIGKA